MHVGMRVCTLVEISITWGEIPVVLRDLAHKLIHRWDKPWARLLINDPIW
jgi:hypothetical protein